MPSRRRDTSKREASTHRARSSKAPAKSKVADSETVGARVAGIWEAIVHAVQQRREYMVAQAAKFELTLPQAHLLRLLEYAPARTMASLADALSCDASNITGIVDRLEARGLIARGAAEHDRRIKTIVMTPAGAKVVTVLRNMMFRPPESLGRLTSGQLATLHHLITLALGTPTKGEVGVKAKVGSHPVQES